VDLAGHFALWTGGTNLALIAFVTLRAGGTDVALITLVAFLALRARWADDDANGIGGGINIRFGGSMIGRGGRGQIGDGLVVHVDRAVEACGAGRQRAHQHEQHSNKEYALVHRELRDG
jgi:hypothetical protein